MFTTIAQFERVWATEAEGTRRILQSLTDESLSQQVTNDHRTLGRIAWHIVTTIPEMMEHVGIKFDEVKADSPIPSTATEMEQAFAAAAGTLLEAIKRDWKDATLDVKDEMYGEKWERRFTLQALVQHQTHHRGQMTVLMRQAGLKVPGIYGPAKEDWGQYGMQPPEV
jgi:uncharacterized damage-inducible protein DinB